MKGKWTKYEVGQLVLVRRHDLSNAQEKEIWVHIMQQIKKCIGQDKCITNVLYVLNVFRRGSSPFSGGHGLTNTDRGFWLYRGGPWLEYTSDMGSDNYGPPLQKIGGSRNFEV